MTIICLVCRRLQALKLGHQEVNCPCLPRHRKMPDGPLWAGCCPSRQSAIANCCLSSQTHNLIGRQLDCLVQRVSRLNRIEVLPDKPELAVLGFHEQNIVLPVEATCGFDPAFGLYLCDGFRMLGKGVELCNAVRENPINFDAQVLVNRHLLSIPYMQKVNDVT